jgi:hypothetical protein
VSRDDNERNEEMRKTIIGATVAATAFGGAAVAFGAGSSTAIGDDEPAIAVGPAPPAIFGHGADGAFAEDLAAELDGVTVGEMRQALEAVAEDRISEHRQELAKAIAAELDGVSVEQVESALATADERMRQAFESGDPPPSDVFTDTLADELGLGEDEISDALAAARDASFEEHRDEAERRLDEAVESGRLSEKEADAIRERLETGPPTLEFRREPGDRGRDLPPPPGLDLPLPAS